MTHPKSKPATISELEERLLAPPEFFSREHKERYQYSMYSGKLVRYIHCEGQTKFALAIWLEVDGNVRKYNERPPALDVHTAEGKSKLAGPDAISIGAKTAPTIHVVDDGERKSFDWEGWCSSHDCLLKRWTIGDLQIGSLLQWNRERLLRFSAHSGVLPDLGLRLSQAIAMDEGAARACGSHFPGHMRDEHSCHAAGSPGPAPAY